MPKVSRNRHRHPYSEYVALESASTVKHEFADGLILAMAGGTPERGALAVSLGAALLGALRGRGCRVLSSDVRVHVRAEGVTTYPDLSVVCGPVELDPEDRAAVTNPTLLVEVPSPSTEAYDRGDKFEVYQALASLRDYVLVAHDRREIEVWHRGEGGWRRTCARAGERAELPSLGCAVDVDQVYADAGL